MRELSAVVEAVDAETPGELDPPWWDDLQSVPDLKRAVLEAEKTDPAGSIFLGRALSNIKEQSTTTLMHRLAVVEHPMLAWALHVELDARDVPPCLRPWMPERSRQSAYLATLADLRWLVIRHPAHTTKYERLRSVFRYPVHDDRWHRAAIWAYRQCRGHRHLLAARLGLIDAMRAHTLTMPNKHQSNDRRLLTTNRSTIIDTMIAHALKHPDKAGQTTAESVAARRVKMLTKFVMLDRNYSETIKSVALIDGTNMSRQTLARHLRSASTAGDCGRIVFGLPQARTLRRRAPELVYRET